MRKPIPLLFALLLANAQAGQATAAELPDSDLDYTYSGSEVQLVEILTRFAENIGVAIDITKKVSARVDTPIGVASRADFLDALALRYRFVWYFDGGVIHVASISEVETATIKMNNWFAHEMEQELRVAGLWEDRFIHAGSPLSRFLVISAPRSFVDTLKSTVEEIDKTARHQTKVIAVIEHKQAPDKQEAAIDALSDVISEAPPLSD